MKNYFNWALLIVITFIFSNIKANPLKNLIQDDTVKVPDVSIVPVVDGIGNEQCWQNVPWQGIDEVWIPYGSSVSSDDYTGRYKIIWSSQTNLLYFLMEVTDDVFVDGYIPGVTEDIYNFDISEVFIDEDKSGGEHRYDGIYNGQNSNAENAFAYHMYAVNPNEGEVNTELHVDDMAGTTFDSHRADYSSHFPEFAMRVKGDTCVREFSLIVYNDTYTEENKDAAKSTLTAGKIMGLSVAYCDNDDPNENPKQRDNMFGSVWEPSPGNLHWMNADYFGTVKLVSEAPTEVLEKKPATNISAIKIYPNPAATSANIELDDSYRGEIFIRMFNILGQQVNHKFAFKTDRLFIQKLQWNHLSPGIYFIQLQTGTSIVNKKLIITGARI